MKPTIQTVYLPADGMDCDFIVRWYDDSYENDVKREDGYFFTPEQLNEYTANVIKEANEADAKNAETLLWQNNEDLEIVANRANYIIEHLDIKKSIINTFEETFKKFEV